MSMTKKEQRLRRSRQTRLRIAQQARDYLPTLIDAPRIGAQWLDLFAGLK